LGLVVNCIECENPYEQLLVPDRIRYGHVNIVCVYVIVECTGGKVGKNGGGQAMGQAETRSKMGQLTLGLRPARIGIRNMYMEL
jgi:hypothetical protein